jgi:hypothetical protein
MDQSPSCEAESRSAGEELLCILWKLEVHRHAHNNSPLHLMLSHLNPIHIVTSYFPKNYLKNYTPMYAKISQFLHSLYVFGQQFYKHL